MRGFSARKMYAPVNEATPPTSSAISTRIEIAQPFLGRAPGISLPSVGCRLSRCRRPPALPSCHRSCTSRLGGRGLTRRIRSSWRLAESNPRNHYWRGRPSAQQVNSRHLLVSQFTEVSVERKCAELCMSCHVLPWLLSVPLKDALRYHCPHGRQRARPE